ncbi:MAG: PAC2 family protein [Chloroflexi bacterium]|nr:PAC2 family protein [Chloroflexota bacterium]
MAAPLDLWERPQAQETVMIAGWEQWADAGSISSGLPYYIIEQSEARKIGQIGPDGYYLFQIPGTHHLLRPVVKLDEGLVRSMSSPTNEFYYADRGNLGLLIFAGDEPHMNEDAYADAILDAAEQTGVRRIIALGGVYGSMPYDKERSVSCSYSLPHMQAEMENYAVRFSNYEGGTTISTFLVHKAAQRGMEALSFHGFVPAYDFGQTAFASQGLRIENDFKAWYDLVRRINHMFGVGIDVSHLREQADELAASMESQLDELAREMPQLNVRAYLAEVSKEFVEHPFMPLDDVWAEGLGDIFGDLGD